ncbi:MBL fold metallo-hydrolase [Mangrovactinospora gilvigrisea]|uniref:MBL fold metallo-hydrolase n=1 Tax=Mangrovactinospora gilvigrisea TaxID=1428644 RepID=A0A1J7C8I5_9ACTN|nr:MBL fold metallo-hydrolase [Mangrovactinospora gilvigrisea]OIV37848.1 MBL fold metallo-hydrolase [Mangrovactinospora gilvigrisea]
MSDDASAGPTPPDGPVTPRATAVLAPNPGPMTLDGTNTWVLAEPGAARVLVVDPGPADEAHLHRVLETATDGGRRTVAGILLTHRHHDHTEGAARFAELAGGAPVRGSTAALTDRTENPLADGRTLAVDGLEVRVLLTPGHTDDSLCLLLPADRALLSGDSVLGRGTSIIAHPDGRLGDYLDTLRRLRTLAADGDVRILLPGHGPVLPRALETVDYYLAHRAARLAQVETSVEKGNRTAAAVVADVYADVDRELWPAAELSVRAQLDYLEEHGLV